MSALFLFGMLLLCHSHAILSTSCEEKSDGDCPDAKTVMTLLNRTYMHLSLIQSPKLQCAYQTFYDTNVYGNKLQRRYNIVFRPRSGKPLDDHMYITNVKKFTIYLSRRPEFPMSPTQLDILYSDLRSCIVMRGPYAEDIPKACRLWLTDSSFANASPECTRGFEKHCGSTAFKYNDTGCI
uniref:Putative secreted protein n=1 Tax=Ixodes ricinus TaxID=34613 RepID=A0A090XET0_IXORI